MKFKFVLIAALAFAAAGCAKSSNTAARVPLTERQRDSILATEPIPGAPVVGKALQVSDAATARASDLGARVDSLPQ